MAIARASRAKRSAKAGSLADRGREDFQGHQPIEVFLPGLVDHAHPAPAHQFQDFQLGEQWRQFGGAGRGVGVGKGDRSNLPERPFGGHRRVALVVAQLDLSPSPPSVARVCGSSARRSRQPGQSPCGPSAASGVPHCGQRFSSVIVVSPCFLQKQKGRKVTDRPINTEFRRRFLPDRRPFGRFLPATIDGSGGEAGGPPFSRPLRSFPV